MMKINHSNTLNNAQGALLAWIINIRGPGTLSTAIIVNVYLKISSIKWSSTEFCYLLPRQEDN